MVGIRNNKYKPNTVPPQQGQQVAITEPSPMVQQMAQNNFALRNGGQLPMQGAPATANGNTGTPSVGTVAPNVNIFSTGGVTGKFTPPIAKTAPDLTPDTPAPDPKYGTEGVKFTNSSNPQQNNLSSLSAALANAGVSPQQPQFEADPNQRDGGFFGWLKGLMPKKRPGMREGETPDEYDRRRTRNMEMMTTFADAIRHIGNIVNTTKYAPSQQFNDPTSMLEQGYQNRKAQRQKQAALDADAAYKQANLGIKERAAEADRLYKQLALGYKDAADKRAAQAAADNKKYKDDYFAWQRDEAAKNRDRQAAQDKQKQENWQKTFDENRRHNTASERISAQKGRGGSGSHGGSGGKYWFEDKDGKMHYQPNKTMYEQEFFREYGYLPNDQSTSTSTKTTDKYGNEKTVTTRSKGSTMTAKAADAQNKAQAARKKAAASKPKPSGGSSKGKGKGHNALNDWFKKNNK